MDAVLLKSFLEVYRSRHFGHAAKNLFISQSAVSARIKQLEDELGIQLFTRERNNIALTTAGKKFLPYAENILNTWNKARLEISIPNDTETLLSVAALPSLWDIFLDDWINWVDNNKFATALQIDAMQSDALMRNLLDGTLDLGFVLSPPKTPEILVMEIQPVPLVMVTNKPSVSLEQALNGNYVYVDWGTEFGMLHARLFHDMNPPRLRANVSRVALSLLNSCDGAAYLPEATVQDQLGSTLFLVENAPLIQKEAYALYAHKSSKKEVIEQALTWFDTNKNQ